LNELNKFFEDFRYNKKANLKCENFSIEAQAYTRYDFRAANLNILEKNLNEENFF